MRIVSRAAWGARHPDGFADAPLPAAEVWLHHSVTLAPDLDWVDADGDRVDDDEKAAMRRLEDIGQDRFGGGISYTFAAMPSGRIYAGHSVDRRGAHTKGRNSIARAIVLVGDYDRHRPTTAQLRAVADLLAHGHRAGWWTRPRLAGGHRQAPGAATACPGRHAMAAIDLINARAATTTQEDPMPTLPEIATAVWSATFGRGDSVTTAGQMLAEARRDSAAALAVVRAVAARPAEASAIDPAELERIITDAADRVRIDVTVTPEGS